MVNISIKNQEESNREATNKTYNTSEQFGNRQSEPNEVVCMPNAAWSSIRLTLIHFL
jgi:hypothetical protein